LPVARKADLKFDAPTRGIRRKGENQNGVELGLVDHFPRSAFAITVVGDLLRCLKRRLIDQWLEGADAGNEKLRNVDFLCDSNPRQHGEGGGVANEVGQRKYLHELRLDEEETLAPFDLLFGKAQVLKSL